MWHFARFSGSAVVSAVAFLFVSAVAADESFPDLPARGTVRFVPTAHETQVPEHFRLTTDEFSFTTLYVRSSGPVRVHRVEFPSQMTTGVSENNTVHGHYFQPAGEGPHPACVVLHILGGDFALAHTTANTLARRGVAAVCIRMPYYGERRGKGAERERRMISRNPQETVEGMTQAVLDIRRAAAWLGSLESVDENRLGVTGISLGGIMSALSAEAEPRFRKVAIYLGGADLVRVIWDSPLQNTAQLRRAWIAAGGTQRSFRDAVSPIDPITHAHLLKGRKVLMVAASHDEIIPKSATLALYNAIEPKPELIWLDAGHITALHYILREMKRLGDFFEPEPD